MTVGQVAVEQWAAEVNRISALRALRRQGAPRMAHLDRITRLARHVLGMPVAFLCVRDADDSWITSGAGLAKAYTERAVSLSVEVVGPEPVTEILDLVGDRRFAEHPMVTRAPAVRSCVAAPVRAPSGRVVGVLSVFDTCTRDPLSGAERSRLADLVAWAELECAMAQAGLGLQETFRTQRDLVAVVSHELRTPLTSVHSSLELLASGLIGVVPRPAGELMEVAVQNIERLVRLINDVLDLSRAQRGELRLRLGDVALDDVIHQALGAVAGIAERAAVPVVVHPGGALVRGDADRLVQVVTNLLANAVSLSPPGVAVEVRCEDGDSHAVIRVIDRGPGLAEEQLDRIFEPFVQDSVEGRPGAGLGLAITRGIVESHGGTVSARSAPGAGATFTVSLPVGGPRDDRPWW
ncbi:GAF domain-containing sensor histidine kinase [Actinophytocola sp.]|uniref:GAF domain-containing sensor histidine kinase n=1 Tax=Actinophytocola sp. TaxID=1872138 RepID=UPI002ED24668